MIPENIKIDELKFVHKSQIGDNEQLRLLGIFEGIAGAKLSPTSIAINNERIYPVAFIEAFYTDFLPFVKKYQVE